MSCGSVVNIVVVLYVHDWTYEIPVDYSYAASVFIYFRFFRHFQYRVQQAALVPQEHPILTAAGFQEP
jgi:hypothetical protein